MGEATAVVNQIAEKLRTVLFVVAGIALIVACSKAMFQGRGWGEAVHVAAVVFVASVVPALVSWLAG
jgi:hypothetical protein